MTKDQITGALDGSITIDNRLLSEQGRASIVKDFTNFTANVGQIAESITNNNIIVQAISTALDGENSLGLVDAVKQYLSLDGKTDKILDSDKLKKEINGATNLDPEKLKESFKEIAEIYNENGEKLQGLEIANINGNIAGLSYVDKSGQKQTIMIDLANVDITDPKAIANIIAHETTNIQSHHTNEANAENRGNMASTIMDMKNYGNENTNNMTTSQWLNQVGSNGVIYANSETIQNGNKALVGSLINDLIGNGTADEKLVIRGAKNFTNTTFNLLQQLTRDELSLKKEKDGMVVVVKENNENDEKSTGTELIRELSKEYEVTKKDIDKNDVEIVYSYGDARTRAVNPENATRKGIGTGSIIFYDPYYDYNSFVGDIIKGGTTSGQDILQHEAIHSYHYKLGTIDKYTPEWQAIGFGKFKYNNSITENKIREEQGHGERIATENPIRSLLQRLP